MKRVVSVSLGSTARDRAFDAEFLGVPFHIERRGTDGSTARYRSLLAELDGAVDCFGVGGMDVYLYAGERRYAFREPLRIVSAARRTPWVDGSGLKHTLERQTVSALEASGQLDLGDKRVLLVVAVDRFGLAEALGRRARSIVYGDILFGLKLPVPLRSWALLQRIAPLILPIVTRLPFQWFYPTGAKQEQRTPRFGRYFEEADVIAGDWHFIRRYMPPRLEGKTVLTNTIRAADVDLLRQAGVSTLITTTPEFGGESFGTNLMEAVLVVLSGRPPEQLTPADYLGTLNRLGWQPRVTHLAPQA